MVLPIVKYGHPVLRKKGARLNGVTPEIKRLIADMLETMRAAHGVGLAAPQVGHALQLCVVDVTPIEDRPSTLEIAGQPAAVNAHMPLILLNPDLRALAANVGGSEGCLSFPEIYGEVARPGKIEVTATNEKGERVKFRAGGLLAKAIQHEHDHLQGILFIDRMTKAKRAELREEIEELQAATKEQLQAALAAKAR